MSEPDKLVDNQQPFIFELPRTNPQFNHVSTQFLRRASVFDQFDNSLNQPQPQTQQPQQFQNTPFYAPEGFQQHLLEPLNYAAQMHDQYTASHMHSTLKRDSFDLIDTSANARRKSVSKGTKIYALRIASQPGIYHSWTYAKTLIEGCPGAKYKGFTTIEECMSYIWEQFPHSTFTMNEAGDFIMDDPEEVFKVRVLLTQKIVADARQKKERTAGLVIKDGMSCYDPDEFNATNVAKAFQDEVKLAIPLNAEQRKANNLVIEGCNLFISGARSTGKGVLLSHIYSHLVAQNKKFHITSASSVTSQNADVTFIPGWTGMGKPLGTKKQILSKVRKNTQARKIWCETDVLIIKDCSMLSAFLIDMIDFLAREIKRKLNVPFGGMQIILIGDIHGLLPPSSLLVSCTKCGQNHRVRQDVQGTASDIITCSIEECRHVFVNCWPLLSFECPVWDEADFRFIPLSMSYDTDLELSGLLSKLENPIFIPNLPILGINRLIGRASGPIEPTLICSGNDEMDKLNDEHLISILDDYMVRYDCIDTVLNSFDFSSRAQQKDGINAETLKLKAGSKVLVLSEDGLSFVNGIVLDFVTPTDEEVEDFVNLYGNSTPQMESSLREWLQQNVLLPKVKLCSTNEVKLISCKIWVVRCINRAAGWRVQLPIRPSYAISLSKCQGVSLDFLKIDGNDDWLPGQMHSALSVAKTFDSIYLSNVVESSFASDPRVIKFLSTAVSGEICKGVLTVVIDEALVPTGPPKPAVKPLIKRNSVSSLISATKRRRMSKTPPLSTFVEDISSSGSQQTRVFTPKLQAQFRRRHSYQPLTPYQEQQYSWITTGNMPLLRSTPSPAFYPMSIGDYQQSFRAQPLQRNMSSDFSLEKSPLSTDFIVGSSYQMNRAENNLPMYQMFGTFCQEPIQNPLVPKSTEMLFPHLSNVLIQPMEVDSQTMPMLDISAAPRPFSGSLPTAWEPSLNEILEPDL